MEEQFLCPLPCGGYNPRQFTALWPSHYYCRKYPLPVHRACLSKYVRHFCPSRVLLSIDPYPRWCVILWGPELCLVLHLGYLESEF
jgi:hypothetical protein